MPADCINDALIECVKACGGSKVIGVRLWPEKGVESAQRYLLDCLNPERPNHKLAPEQVMLILRWARERGFHGGMEFVSTELGYTMPQPIKLEDAADELTRRIERMLGDLNGAVADLKRMKAGA